jgi:glutamyl-Q tRNA(Asp) synthetase
LSDKPYPGTCRKGIKSDAIARSIRIETNNDEIYIKDKLQGRYAQYLETEVGDYIIKRADGFFAYHLVVVVDDNNQNITEVVRGVDLLDSTPRQVYLQKTLSITTPSYLHLPLAVDRAGKKISKTTNAKSVTSSNVSEILCSALNFLGQNPPNELTTYDVESILNWSIQNWNLNLLPKEREIKLMST